ncbi:zinc ribbon domain-containing protein [Marinilactibacillus sp. Marseille-P9653]|uniref:zinc ribbon domain-containing protein n=1 Tax=Marinilactibacillus sp. Marseille-P9653 TaxID=2866583 RepID=UPI001CE3C9B7|nr:zinc-ribbon domain-containing protein [Marinilactibacillus sp. Marseille-P9653]
MKFCENCGHKLEGNQKFCEKCGAKVKPVEIENKSSESTSGLDKTDQTNVTAHNQEPLQKNKQNTLTKPNNHNPVPKPIIAGLVIIVLLITGSVFGYQKGKEYYSLNNQIDRYIETLQSRNYSEIAAVLTTSNENFEISEDTIAPYVDSILYDADWGTIRYELISSRSTDTLLLKKNGSNFVFFDRYELELLPAMVTLTTNLANTKLFIEEEEVATADKDDYSVDIKTVMPGMHTFYAKTELDGQEMVTEETMNVWPGQHDPYVSLPIQGVYFEVSSNINDASVYLNDKNVGQLSGGSGEFGPFGSLNGGNLELRQEKDFGELKTESIELSDNDYTYYQLDFADAMTEDDAQYALQGMYDTLSSLTSEYQYSLTEDEKAYGEYFYEGVAYDELRPFYLEYAERQRDDEQVMSVNYDVTVSNFEQTGLKEYSADLEVDYTSYFQGTEANDYNAPDNRIRTFTYNVSLISDKAIRNNWNYSDEELFINGFANEEMIYDSNN